MSGELLFRLPAIILDTLVYLGLYKFVLQMETDLVLTVVAFKKRMKVDRDKTAPKDDFGHYDFIREEVLGLEEQSV